MTGGGGFGGGLFWSLFCADTASDRPTIIAHINNRFLSVVIALVFLFR
jgi:hypothetical protein